MSDDIARKVEFHASPFLLGYLSMSSTEPQQSELETPEGWKRFIEQSFAQEHQEFAFEYTIRLLERNLPVLFDIEHVARRIGTPGDLIRAIVANSAIFYRSFSIPKRSGGIRAIQAPYPSALCVQRWILKSILSKFLVTECAHGFVRGRSILTNAAAHVAGTTILR